VSSRLTKVAIAGICDGSFVRDDPDAGDTVSRSLFVRPNVIRLSRSALVVTQSDKEEGHRNLGTACDRACPRYTWIRLDDQELLSVPYLRTPIALHAHHTGLAVTDDPNAACQWCKYLSCIPTKSNDHCSGTVSCLPDIDT
jgi:hypothetical protein